MSSIFPVTQGPRICSSEHRASKQLAGVTTATSDGARRSSRLSVQPQSRVTTPGNDRPATSRTCRTIFPQILAKASTLQVGGLPMCERFTAIWGPLRGFRSSRLLHISTPRAAKTDKYLRLTLLLKDHSYISRY